MLARQALEVVGLTKTRLAWAQEQALELPPSQHQEQPQELPRSQHRVLGSLA